MYKACACPLASADRFTHALMAPLGDEPVTGRYLACRWTSHSSMSCQRMGQLLQALGFEPVGGSSTTCAGCRPRRCLRRHPRGLACLGAALVDAYVGFCLGDATHRGLLELVPTSSQPRVCRS